MSEDPFKRLVHTEDWEKETRDRIKFLEDQKIIVQQLHARIIASFQTSELERQALNQALTSMEVEIYKLTAELEIHKLLTGQI